MKIVIATKNKGKLQEIKAILSDEKYEIVSMNDMGIDIEVDEDADTFSGNAQKKAIEIMNQLLNNPEYEFIKSDYLYFNDNQFELKITREEAIDMGFSIEAYDYILESAMQVNKH